jgi:hypothetical protein
MLTLPGLALVYAMNSETVFAGKAELTTTTKGPCVIGATGAMSRTKVKFRLSYSVAFVVAAGSKTKSV